MNKVRLPFEEKMLCRTWGLQVIPMSEYRPEKNDKFTIIISDKIDDNALFFDNALSIVMSYDAFIDLVNDIANSVDEEFMEIFVSVINEYAKYRAKDMYKSSSAFYRDAINRMMNMFHQYGLHINQFRHQEYLAAVKHFGSHAALKYMIFDAVYYETDTDASGIDVKEFTKCYRCKHAKVNRHGDWVCKKRNVPITHKKKKRKYMGLRLFSDYVISNYLDDIVPTFKIRNECPIYKERTHKIIDWSIHVRDKIMGDEIEFDNDTHFERRDKNDAV